MLENNKKSANLKEPGISHSLQTYSKAIRRDYLLYMMVVPGVIWFILFCYVPMYGITLAFREYNIFDGFKNAPFVGLNIFSELFALPSFSRSFNNTVILSIMKLVFGFPTPIILSLLMNEVINSKYKKYIQTSVLLPNFISWVVMGSLIYSILSPNSGVIKEIFSLIGQQESVPDLLTNKQFFRWLLVGSDIWKSAGYGTIVYLGAITGIDPDLYESASIDGAGKLRQIWHITLTSIRPIIIIVFLFRMGALLNVGFEQIFIMSNPLVLDVSEILDTYVYKIGVVQQQYSLSTAAGLFKSLIGLALVIIANYISNKVEPDSGIL